jgi:hypothetical protein
LFHAGASFSQRVKSVEGRLGFLSYPLFSPISPFESALDTRNITAIV